MKDVQLCLIALCLLLNSSCYAGQSSLVGNWVDVGEVNQEDIPIHVFSLDITQADQVLLGKYCYVSNYGRRDDCNNQIRGQKISANTYKINFDSAFGAKNGISTLKIIGNELFWNLVKAPKNGDYSIPKKSLLKRGR